MKKLLSIVVLSSFTAIPLSVQAAPDITIVNKTDANATVELPYLPACTGPNPKGIIFKQTSKTLPGVMIDRVCKNHEKACTGIIYASDDCSGEAIAKVTINIPENAISAENYGVKGYKVSISGNSVILEKVSFLRRLFS